jgi:ribosomal protein S18 acetylase RimI-like enzyme
LRERVPEFHGSGTSVPATFRPLADPDSAAVRALVISVLADVSYAEPMLAALERAIQRAGDEYRAIVACEASAPVGLIVFGEVAGARGAGRIHLVAVDPNARQRGIALHLIDTACATLRERGCRLVTIELPADARIANIRRLAGRAGFREEGRIDDFVGDGVALVLLRRDL